MNYKIINGDCLKVLPELPSVSCIFADPPDNIGLNYNQFQDQRPDDVYVSWLKRCVELFCSKAKTVWISFNSKWTAQMGAIVLDFLEQNPDWKLKPCVQTFTFGQHRQEDLGNHHRPLWRLKQDKANLYPHSIRIPSWRQQNGDTRADPRGRVPGDVFDFPRVTGNSKQRRSWHPTQLHEELVQRCILLSTKHGDSVIDPFGGTGTTLRVCKKLRRQCTLIELDKEYCIRIAEEHNIPL